MPGERLTPQMVQERIEREDLGWTVEEGRLVRTYRTGSWQNTLMAANAVGLLAEAANHHPDMLLRYASLRLTLVTHDAGGLTEADLALATQIERLLAGWRAIG